MLPYSHGPGYLGEQKGASRMLGWLEKGTPLTYSRTRVNTQWQTALAVGRCFTLQLSHFKAAGEEIIFVPSSRTWNS